MPREEGGQTPALALTAYARTEDRVRALSAGFQMHLAKPTEPRVVVRVRRRRTMCGALLRSGLRSQLLSACPCSSSQCSSLPMLPDARATLVSAAP